MTVTLKHVMALCNRLRDIGSDAYVCAPDGFYDVTMPNITSERTPELRDLYNVNTKRWPPLNKGIVDDLKKMGFESYSFFARNQGTISILGHHANGHRYVLRNSLKTDEQRIESPLVSRAYYRRLESGVISDVTSVLQILKLHDSDTPSAQKAHSLWPGDNDANEAMEHILDTVLVQFMSAASCQAQDPVSKDLGVMPDGTPLQPDPGQIQYAFSSKLYPDRVLQAIHRFRELTFANDLPEQLRWFAPDGTWKQDKFFADPTARMNYRAGCTVAT